MSDTTVNEASTPAVTKRVKFDDTLREEVKCLWVAGYPAHVIARQKGVDAAVIRNWASRGKWHHLRNVVGQQVDAAVVKTVTHKLSDVSEQLRERLSHDLLKQSEVLEAEPPKKLSDLANTKARQGRTAVVKTIAETASMIYGWSDQAAERPLVVVGIMEKSAPDAIDITAQQMPVNTAPNEDLAQLEAMMQRNVSREPGEGQRLLDQLRQDWSEQAADECITWLERVTTSEG